MLSKQTKVKSKKVKTKTKKKKNDNKKQVETVEESMSSKQTEKQTKIKKTKKTKKKKKKKQVETAEERISSNPQKTKKTKSVQKRRRVDRVTDGTVLPNTKKKKKNDNKKQAGMTTNTPFKLEKKSPKRTEKVKSKKKTKLNLAEPATTSKKHLGLTKKNMAENEKKATNKTKKKRTDRKKNKPKMSHATSDKNLEVSFENKKASETTDALKRGVGTVRCLAELQNKFLTHRPMNVSLFEDFKTYSTSLPVRKRNKEWLKLHTLPYFCSDEDVTRMATQLEQAPPSNVRDSVKYVCAPSGSGKTCSILPAFLKSKKFTHYLYIAFDNNNGRKFTLAPYKPLLDECKAEKQGAAFILKCVTLLLSGDEPREISVEEHCFTRCATTDLRKLIHKSFGQDSKVLFHVDEHRKMCSRSGDADVPGACFSRCAMETLAAVGTVVATYIEPPPASAGFGSSSVCRQPVALPCLDLEKILKHVDLVLPDTLNKENKRLLAVLRTRIAMALQPAAIGVGGLHRIGSSKQHEKLITQLKDKLDAAEKQQGKKQKKYLEDCIFACPLPRSMDTVHEHEHATDLLLGMSDEMVQKFGRRMNNLVVLPNGLLSTTIFQLFSFQDKDEARNRIYKVGRDRFHHAIQYDKDCMSGRPLEEAYLWTLSCSSLLKACLSFKDIRGKNISFPIKCTNIKPGRIFHTNDTAVFDLSDLQHNTMYYADETGRGENKYSHPLADMFFRTENNHLVLIDIKGATVRTVKKKVTHLGIAIGKMQRALATDITDWSVEQVYRWANRQPENEYAEQLKKKKVDGRALVELTVEKLVKWGIPDVPAERLMKGVPWCKQIDGVVLVPTINSPTDELVTSASLNSITVVCGENARGCLGGLDQLFRYMNQ